MSDALLYGVNMFYYHWLIKKLLWPMAGQNITRQETQTETGERRQVREMPVAAREARCEVTSHKPCGKI